jgi:hypothetical protein
MLKTFVLASALACCTLVQAQTAPAPSTPAKKELVAKVLAAQQPSVEQLARQLVEQPAAQMLQRAGTFIQAKIPADKREALARELQADARKYVDETYPLVRDRAMKLAPLTVGVLLDEKMTEDELRQVLAVFESAAWRKFQGLGMDMQKAIGEKLVADVKDKVEPRVRALDNSMAKKLGITPPPAASGAASGK